MKALVWTLLLPLTLFGGLAPLDRTSPIPINPSVRDECHVTFVNVSNAVSSCDWAIVAPYAAQRSQLKVWTNSIEQIDCVALLNNVSAYEKDHDGKSLLTVFVVNSKSLPDFFQVPGHWCVVNLSWLSSDNPKHNLWLNRIAKALLRGLVYAGGAGSTINGHCVMFHRADTLAEFDEVGIQISPMAALPLREAILQIEERRNAKP